MKSFDDSLSRRPNDSDVNGSLFKSKGGITIQLQDEQNIKHEYLHTNS